MAEQKQKNSRRSFPAAAVVSILVGVAAGLIAGQLIDDTKSGSEFLLLLILAVFAVGAFLGIIIHEAGHLVMGLLTGYKFLSFRIGSLTLVKTPEGLKLRKFTIPGTGGQCLMIPPEVDDPETTPYFWYNAGGGLFNILTALLCIPGILLTSGLVSKCFLLFAVISVAFALMNLIPMRKGQIANDGGNILQLYQIPYDRGVLWRQFTINARQTLGERLERMPESLFATPADKGSYLSVVMYHLRGLYLLEHRDFAAAEAMFRQCAEHPEVLDIHKNEARSELLFCHIMQNAPAEEIETLYDADLQKYVETTAKYYIGRVRLLYAHELLCKQNTETAGKLLALAQKMRRTYPVIGEYDAELDMMEFVRAQAA